MFWWEEEEKEEEEEEEESIFKADAVNEEDSERDRYPGVEDEFRRATFLGESVFIADAVNETSQCPRSWD